MDEKTQTKNTIKGITLIALVVTIIVLLILAGVSIVTLTGQDNILENANSAKKQTNEATEKEKVELAASSARIAGEGKLNIENLQTAIGEQFGVGKNVKLIGEEDGPWTYEGDINSYTIDNQGIVKVVPVTGPLGEATNLENFGKKVDFTSKGEEQKDLTWRIFYEDSNNVYLISEKESGGTKDYPISKLQLSTKITGEKYKNGSKVSKQGQDLMPLAKELFKETNTNNNIKATAYMCDTSCDGPWKNYKDNEGKAAWAMGGPTIELFVKSYNASQKKSVQLTCDSVGYNDPKTNGITMTMCNGIYRLKDSDGWWLVAPSNHTGTYMRDVNDLGGYFGNDAVSLSSYGARPVVCIPRSNFNGFQITD